MKNNYSGQLTKTNNKTVCVSSVQNNTLHNDTSQMREKRRKKGRGIKCVCVGGGGIWSRGVMCLWGVGV